jgi:hypothetical protein
MPFLCTPRVLNSTEDRVALQVTDLFPNKTQHSAVFTPNFQGPMYFHAPVAPLTEEVELDADFATTADFSGLAVYLLTTVEDSNGGRIAITADMANEIASDIVERMQKGLSLTSYDINVIISTRTGAPNNPPTQGIALGNTSATVLEILQIVSGYKVYSVPAGQDVEDAGAFRKLLPNAQAGFFSDPSDASKLYTNFDNTFILSAKSGQIKKAQTRKDAKGEPEPLVVVYADDGTLIQ